MLKKLSVALLCVALALSPVRAAGPTVNAVNSPQSALTNLTARAVSLGSTGDQGSIAIPSYVTAYQVTKFLVTNCSTTPVLAQVGLFTAASAGGIAVSASAIITGATSISVVLSQTIASSARLTASTLFVNVAVANVAALTCDLKVSIEDLT